MMQRFYFLILATCVSVYTGEDYKKKYFQCLDKLLCLDIQQQNEKNISSTVFNNRQTHYYIQQWQDNQKTIEEISSIISTLSISIFRLSHSCLEGVFCRYEKECIVNHTENSINLINTLNAIRLSLQKKNNELESFLYQYPL